MQWDLAPVLRSCGSLLFPHATLEVCGHQIAAVVRACFESRANQVVALGVLHALTPQLQLARARVAAGADPADEPTWSIQGPGIEPHNHWQSEFSLSHFQFLWDYAATHCYPDRPTPQLILRYPHLAGGRPDMMPGVDELDEMVQLEGSVVVATMDPFHHGIGYGDLPEAARSPEIDGLELARLRIEENLAVLCTGDYREFNSHCIDIRSDGRDVGQLLGYLTQPASFTIFDLVADDMSGPYDSPSPTWVAGALIALHR